MSRIIFDSSYMENYINNNLKGAVETLQKEYNTTYKVKLQKVSLERNSTQDSSADQLQFYVDNSIKAMDFILQKSLEKLISEFNTVYSWAVDYYNSMCNCKPDIELPAISNVNFNITIGNNISVDVLNSFSTAYDAINNGKLVDVYTNIVNKENTIIDSFWYKNEQGIMTQIEITPGLSIDAAATSVGVKPEDIIIKLTDKDGNPHAWVNYEMLSISGETTSGSETSNESKMTSENIITKEDIVNSSNFDKSVLITQVSAGIKEIADEAKVMLDTNGDGKITLEDARKFNEKYDEDFDIVTGKEMPKDESQATDITDTTEVAVPENNYALGTLKYKEQLGMSNSWEYLGDGNWGDMKPNYHFVYNLKEKYNKGDCTIDDCYKELKERDRKFLFIEASDEALKKFDIGPDDDSPGAAILGYTSEDVDDLDVNKAIEKGDAALAEEMKKYIVESVFDSVDTIEPWEEYKKNFLDK